MMKVFKMTDLGLMTYFLGMEVVQVIDQVVLHQTRYAKNLLKKFNMSSCKLVSTPLCIGAKFSKENGYATANRQTYKSIIGSLLYLSATRPDIMFDTWLLSKFIKNPSEAHFTTVKRILRYVKGTIDFGLKYLKQKSNQLLGYTNIDQAGSLDDSKITGVSVSRLVLLFLPEIQRNDKWWLSLQLKQNTLLVLLLTIMQCG